MTRTVPQVSRRARRAAAPLLLAGTLALVTTSRAAAQQATGASPWTLGMDATFGSERLSFRGGPDESRTLLLLPRPRARLGYELSPALQLEFPLGITYASREGFSVASALLGVDANFRFAARGAVRPFVGAGGRVRLVRSHEEAGMLADVGSSSESAAQAGFAARAGLDWQAFPSLSVRPALFYEQLAENSSKGLPRDRELGASFGATMHFGQPAAADRPLPFQLSVGADLTRRTFGRVDGEFPVSEGGPAVALLVPSPSFGLFFPVTRSRQVMVGGNAQVVHLADNGLTSTQLRLQPRVELDLNPRYRTERGMRLGAHANYLRDASHSDRFDVSGSRDRYGAGGDVSLTFPVAPGLLTRVGLGFDFIGAMKGERIPSERAISLKFGFDAL